MATLPTFVEGGPSPLSRIFESAVREIPQTRVTSVADKSRCALIKPSSSKMKTPETTNAPP